jgi:hypothetical protein
MEAKLHPSKNTVSIFTYLTIYGEDIWFNTQATVCNEGTKHFYTDKMPIDRDNLFQSVLDFTRVRQISYSVEGCVIEAICLQLGIKIDRQTLETDPIDQSSFNKMEELSFGDKACHISFCYDDICYISYRDILHCYYTTLKYLHGKVEAYAKHNI